MVSLECSNVSTIIAKPIAIFHACTQLKFENFDACNGIRYGDPFRATIVEEMPKKSITEEVKPATGSWSRQTSPDFRLPNQNLPVQLRMQIQIKGQNFTEDRAEPFNGNTG